MPAVSKKQQKFMQAVAHSPKFAKKVGVKQSIGKEFTKEKDMKKVKKMNMGGMADREGRAMATGRYANDPRMMADARGRAMMKKGGKVNTSKMNNLEELGRVDAEKGYTAKGKKNLKGEKKRLVSQIKKGYAGGGVLRGKQSPAMEDKEGRALAKNKKGMSSAKMIDARGRALSKAKKGAMAGGLEMKAKGKAYKKGGAVKGSASKRADGIAQQGHTRGRMV